MKNEDRENIYCVYWIHLDTETDPFTQGYIGVTCNLERRFARHRAHAVKKDSKRNSFPLYCAFRKYGIERFKFDVLESGIDINSANVLELKYRPHRRIGYNIDAGSRWSFRHPKGDAPLSL